MKRGRKIKDIIHFQSSHFGILCNRKDKIQRMTQQYYWTSCEMHEQKSQWRFIENLCVNDLGIVPAGLGNWLLRIYRLPQIYKGMKA